MEERDFCALLVATLGRDCSSFESSDEQQEEGREWLLLRARLAARRACAQVRYRRPESLAWRSARRERASCFKIKITARSLGKCCERQLVAPLAKRNELKFGRKFDWRALIAPSRRRRRRRSSCAPTTGFCLLSWRNKKGNFVHPFFLASKPDRQTDRQTGGRADRSAECLS